MRALLSVQISENVLGDESDCSEAHNMVVDGWCRLHGGAESRRLATPTGFCVNGDLRQKKCLVINPGTCSEWVVLASPDTEGGGELWGYSAAPSPCRPHVKHLCELNNNAASMSVSI